MNSSPFEAGVSFIFCQKIDFFGAAPQAPKRELFLLIKRVWSQYAVAQSWKISSRYLYPDDCYEPRSKWSMTFVRHCIIGLNVVRESDPANPLGANSKQEFLLTISFFSFQIISFNLVVKLVY